MDFLKYTKIFGSLLILIVALDVLWIGFIAQSMYQTQIGHLLNKVADKVQFNMLAGLLVWVLLVLGNLVFVLPQAKSLSMGMQFGLGALFGLVVYGVYDFTNYATLVNWPLFVTIIDVIWGMILNGVIAVASVYVSRLF